MFTYPKTTIAKDLVLGALLIATLGTLGSLYFSEIAGFPPCVLCWYQRIALYPLIPIIAIGYVLKDKNMPFYVLPLSLVGLVISVYHNLLYWHIIPESLAPCVQGISCTTKYVSWFGFITIPLLAFLAFTAITLFIGIYWYIEQKEHKKKMS